MTTTFTEFQLNNASENPIAVAIEPWGDVRLVEARSSMRLRIEGPLSNDPSQVLIVQIENEKRVSVWGWTGSAITEVTQP